MPAERYGVPIRKMNLRFFRVNEKIFLDFFIHYYTLKLKNYHYLIIKFLPDSGVLNNPLF